MSNPTRKHSKTLKLLRLQHASLPGQTFFLSQKAIGDVSSESPVITSSAYTQNNWH